MSLRSRPAVARQRVLVHGCGHDAVACAGLLAADGNDVTLVTADGQPTGTDVAVRSGVRVRRDRPDDIADILVVDCWTAETAPIVVRHRAAGAYVTSIGDLVLQRCRAHTLGVTGSGGKTTATRLAVEMMRASGMMVTASTSARAGNAWPAAELLDGLPGPASPDWLAVELTSTHLAYMHTSPDVAVITAFWPDHVELHGSLERYRSAKTTILRHQRPGGVCIVNVDDVGAATFADDATGIVLEASAERPVASGIGTEGDHVVARLDAVTRLCRRDAIPVPVPLASIVVSAACAALTCGADPQAVAAVMVAPPVLPHRRQVLGTIAGVAVVDDSAATTPRKARGALSGRDRSCLVVIVGGDLDVGGRPVHDSPAEDAEREHMVRDLAACREVIAFGPAAVRVPGAAQATTLAQACAMARHLATPGDTIVLAPMFPLSPRERAAFPRLMGLHQDGDRTTPTDPTTSATG